EGGLRSCLRGGQPSGVDRRSAAWPCPTGGRGADMNDMTEPPGLAPGVAEELTNATLGDPFGTLGPHHTVNGRVVRAYVPGALEVEAVARAGGVSLGRLAPLVPSGLFVGALRNDEPYLLRITWPGAVQETEDPYSFGPLLGDLDLHLFNEGRHFE